MNDAVDDGCLVEKSFLSKVAFDLLSSSSVERYARMALGAGRRWSVEPALSPTLQAGSVLRRARHLWELTCAATNREPWEVELAILLSAMSVASTPGIDDFFEVICAAATEGPRRWIVGLVHVLWPERRKTIADDAAMRIQVILCEVPDEETRRLTLQRVMKNRCPKCFDYNESGQFWCCYESRGG